jgi:hypothetical protein
MRKIPLSSIAIFSKVAQGVTYSVLGDQHEQQETAACSLLKLTRSGPQRPVAPRHCGCRGGGAGCSCVATIQGNRNSPCGKGISTALDSAVAVVAANRWVTAVETLRPVRAVPQPRRPHEASSTGFRACVFFYFQFGDRANSCTRPCSWQGRWIPALLLFSRPRHLHAASL